MRPEQILQLLGRPAADPAIVDLRDAHGIAAAPSLRKGPPDEQSWHAWVLSREAGIELGFQDQADFLAQDPRLRGQGPLVLTQVCFYFRHPGLRPYRGGLPFDILPSDGRDDVRRKMSSFDAVRRSHIRDVWDLPQFRMIVAYDEQDAKVASVLCLLPVRPWPADTDQVGEPPNVAQLVRALGQAGDSEPFREAFARFRLGAFGFDPREPRHWTMRHAYGFDLSLVEAEPAEPEDAPPPPPTLASIKLFRERYLDAYGWKGDLPCGMSFDDPRDVIVRKLARPPDESEENDMEGFALWSLKDFVLHVMYSNVHNHVLRVTLLHPDAWGDADADG